MNVQARTPGDIGLDLSSAQAPKSETKTPLTEALLYLAAHHGRAISRDALLANLPILDGKLTPALFERAARRAGLEAQAVKRKISKIPALVLPVVLTMRDGSAPILLSVDQHAGTASIIDPCRESSTRSVAIKTIAADYLGYAFFVRPASEVDARAVAAGDMPKPHWFWSVARRFVANYSHVAISALVINTLALATPLFVMSVYDRIIPNGAIPSLIALGIGMVIAIVFDFIIRNVRARIIDVTSKKLDVVVASDIFEHALAVKMAQRPPSVGTLAQQIRDFDSVKDFFTSGTVVSIVDLLFAGLFIAVLFMIAGPLAWVPIIMLPVMITVGLGLQFPLQRSVRRHYSEAAARHGILVETLAGVETIRATGSEKRMQTTWERSVAATARSGEDVYFWSSLALTSANTAQQVTYLAMVVLGVYLILHGQLTIGALVASAMLSMRVLSPISGIAAVISRATQTIIAFKALNRVMALERERPPERTYVSRRIESGSIAFDGVTFRYPTGVVHALDGISFRIRPGERVGIIGRVGSGKTTVGRLLAGFYEPDIGRVLVDDIDIRQYDPADLRTGVGFVLQDTDLFFGKLRDNIALGKPEATDEEIIAAARLAGVESFIAGHPLGYEMPIAEGGRSLSGGQKQAIGLARALIRRPKILFLDEPTAHFDTRSEAEFLKRLKTLGEQDLTILISTHRMSLLSFVERLLVFDQGKLIADGPRDKVIAALQGAGAKRPAAAAAPASTESKSGATL